MDKTKPLRPSSKYSAEDYAAKAAEKRWETLHRSFNIERPSGNLTKDLEAGKPILFQRGLHLPFCRIAADASSDYDVEFIASTDGPKRDPYIVHNDGWELQDFMRNPILLWCHDYYGLPLGHHVAADTVKARNPESGQMESMLRLRAQFASKDVYPFADTVRKLYLARHLRTCSVSWEPISGQYKEIYDRAGRKTGIEFFRQILTENSCVPLPSDSNALAVAVQSRILSTDEVENFARFAPTMAFARSVAYTVSTFDGVIDDSEEKMNRAAADPERVSGLTPGREGGHRTVGGPRGERPSKARKDPDKRPISYPTRRSLQRGAMADTMTTSLDQLVGQAIVFWNDIIPAMRNCIANCEYDEESVAAGYPNANVRLDKFQSTVKRAQSALMSMSSAVDGMATMEMGEMARTAAASAERVEDILSRIGKAISQANDGKLREVMGGIMAASESLSNSLMKLSDMLDGKDPNAEEDEEEDPNEEENPEEDATEDPNAEGEVGQDGLTEEERKKAEKVFRSVAELAADFSSSNEDAEGDDLGAVADAMSRIASMLDSSSEDSQ